MTLQAELNHVLNIYLQADKKFSGKVLMTDIVASCLNIGDIQDETGVAEREEQIYYRHHIELIGQYEYPNHPLDMLVFIN
jgi:hypothetical protein